MNTSAMVRSNSADTVESSHTYKHTVLICMTQCHFKLGCGCGCGCLRFATPKRRVEPLVLSGMPHSAGQYPVYPGTPSPLRYESAPLKPAYIHRMLFLWLWRL
jgi:hypothetical protein